MGHVLPDEKSAWIALTNIYGIGRVRSQKILEKVNIDPMKKVKDLSEDEQKKISDELKNYVLESDLKREDHPKPEYCQAGRHVQRKCYKHHILKAFRAENVQRCKHWNDSDRLEQSQLRDQPQPVTSARIQG